jgi:hypothetical protein
MTRFLGEAPRLSTVYQEQMKSANIASSVLLQVDDLSRMYRLFSRITRGLEPVSQIFKQVFCFSEESGLFLKSILMM